MSAKPKYSPLTYTQLPLTDRQLAPNCDKLALLMERVPARKHDQGIWIVPGKNECGTSGCALGWAAMSNWFPGLQYVRNGDATHELMEFQPVINGKRSHWFQAGREFFGSGAYINVFVCAGNREEIAHHLRLEAARLRGTA